MPDTPGKYIFMHKNKPIAELTLESSSGAILSIGTVYEPLHVPVGVPVKKGMIDRGALNALYGLLCAAGNSRYQRGSRSNAGTGLSDFK